MRLHFVCVGGNKCGTTWLYEMLIQHPELSVADNKEPHYFSSHYDRGPDWYESNWRADEGLRGEFSTSYLYDDQALERLADDVPDVRVLILLRHPIERAVSHFRHRLRSEEEVNDYGNFLASHPEILTNSLYGRRFTKLEELFVFDQIAVFYFVDIRRRPLQLLTEVFRFLGVDPDFVPDGYSEPVGRAFSPRSRHLEDVRLAIYRFLKEHGFHQVMRWVKRSKTPRLYRSLNDAGISEDRIREIRDVLVSHRGTVLRDLELLESSSLIADSTQVQQWRGSLITNASQT